MAKMQVTEAKGLRQEAVQEIFVRLLSGAKKSVFLSSGLWPDFYRDDNVRNAINRAAKECESFRILVDPRVDAKNRLAEVSYLLPLASSGDVTIKQATHPIPHWLIVDQRNMRLEEPHPITEPSGTNMQIQDATDEIVEQVDRKTDQMWVHATTIDFTGIRSQSAAPAQPATPAST
jgi:hypothetical protein